jgi:integrase
MPRRDYPGHLLFRRETARYRVNIHGVFRRCTFQTADPKEAARLARSQHARWEAELLGGGSAEGRASTSVDLRLDDLIERFLDHLAAKVKDGQRASGTLRTYKQTLSFFQRFFGNNPSIADINPDHVAEYLRWRRTQLGGAKRARKNRTETSARTREKDYVTLRTLFNFAVDREYLTRSPVKKADRPAPAPKPRREMLKPAQVDAVIAGCGDRPMLAMWVLLLADTGMRPSEALALRWQDVNLDRAEVTIGRGRPTKTKRERTVPLSPRLLAALRDHFTKYRVPGRAALVLHHLTARRHHEAGATINGLSRAFAGAVERAKLPPAVTPYWLRHSFATNLAEAGAALAKVSHFLGHTTLETTKKYYVHLGVASLRELVDGSVRNLHE